MSSARRVVNNSSLTPSLYPRGPVRSFVVRSPENCDFVLVLLIFSPFKHSNMSGIKRKSSGDEAGSAKKRQAITMETKVNIIKRVERGEKMADVARSYQMNRSTIGTILKNKDKIMEHVKSSVPMHSTIISKKCGKVIDVLTC